jgi:transcriptional regulator with XRE-family HTH domain
MTAFGGKLRLIRQQWNMSLRQVELRSNHLAEAFNDPSYRLSAGWLNRLEREEHELTINKLVSLSKIYDIPTERLLEWIRPTATLLDPLGPFAVPNGMTLLMDGQSDEQAGSPPIDLHNLSCVTPQTGLLCSQLDRPLRQFAWGIIGMRDYTLDPMIPPGSVVQIDPQNKSFCRSKEWSSEFQRPIYFLLTRSEYICGWCEVEEGSGWLTLIPHPLSTAPVRRWKYPTEIEVVGRVVAVKLSLKKQSNRSACQEPTGSIRTRQSSALALP